MRSANLRLPQILLHFEFNIVKITSIIQLKILFYPPNGSTAIPLGFFNPVDTSTARFDPSALATSILSVPESVQNMFPVIKSTAIPKDMPKMNQAYR